MYLLFHVIDALLIPSRYGETEFWAALGKMLLIIGLIFYTFIAMLGGNPLGDVRLFPPLLAHDGKTKGPADFFVPV